MSDYTASLDAPIAKPRPSAPPLRIHHILVWTAVTAAIISGCMWFERTARNGPPMTNWLALLGLMLLAIAVAGALTCTGCAIAWNRQGYSFPNSPGEWLLKMIAFAALAVFWVIAGAFIVFFIEEDVLMVYYAVAAILAVIAWIYACAVKGARLYSDTDSWRMVFGVMLLSPLVVFGSAYAGVNPVRGPILVIILVVLVCLAIASIGDRRYRIPRAWTHWFGVSMAALVGVAFAMIFAAMQKVI